MKVTKVEVLEDGYTFAFLPNSNLALSPQVNKLSYKNPDDVLPVMINTVNFSPVLLVPVDSPYMNLGDLLQAAKKSPGPLSVGFSGVADNALDVNYQDGPTTRDAAWADYRKYTSILKLTGLVK
ncbi:tripartite tricarboxylate transporter substrate-binding protein [Acidovorax sp. MR-S7]|uniref:tripartite tricarboxylate transporter substrate-binding protein n=1 Tax=Acidovorax sp. MR-S7 TaxID=1268622 RepID=UPI0003721FF0|nr:tripartite tricarboxylate transporter substrate-binding protein [Acidovorax sp. MR-S7]GAD24538.1 hypothetical protein AVS7_04298 [Acidovorax sp. MR-S7]